MSTHKALLLLEKQGDFAVQDLETYKPGPGELLVEVRAAALNPADWKIQAAGLIITNYPAVLGADSAGIVKEIGEGVIGFAVGDKILHEGWYTPNTRAAAFQQYTTVPAEIAAKLPSNISLEEGSTIPAAVITAAYGLYSKKVAHPGSGGAGLTPAWVEGGRGKYSGQPIVIIGGSSAVGQQVLQFAKLSGFSPIITTASSRNAAYLKSLGATHVVDRDTPLASAVKAITSESVKLVYDAISEKETQGPAYEVLASGGTFVLLLPPQLEESKIDKTKEVVSVYGSAYDLNQRALGTSLFQALTGLLESGDIKPNKVEIVPNGLAGIPDALEKLKAGKVSATKLVAQPWA